MANVRMLALRLLEGRERDETYLNLALSSPMTEGLTPSERGLLTALLYGTVEREITLDYMIAAAAERSELDPTTRNILRLGFYQLFFMDKIPPFAAVSETVSLASSRPERNFVNGVMRGALRRFVDESGARRLPVPPREKNLARHLSVLYAMPPHLVRHFLTILGREEGEALLSAMNTRPDLTLAVNTTRITRDGYLAMLEEAGIPASPTRRAPRGVRIHGSLPVARLPGFGQGLVYVQDEASQLTAEVLAPTAGERIFDVCACPGGKSFAAAIRMGDAGEIRAYDLHESKLPLIEEGSARLGLRSVAVAIRDASIGEDADAGCADRVLCDVPCSGLGVLWKKPDLRHADPARMTELPALQSAILETSSRYVKRGGRILYSTCTLNPAENEGVFDAFLEKHPEFAAVPFAVADLSAPMGRLTLYPHIHATDGFFMALAERVR